MTTDYNLMFLKTERDFAELDRNNLQKKLVEAKCLISRLAFLGAPQGEKLCASIQRKTIEKELHKAMDKLNELRLEVEEREQGIS